MQSKPIGQFFCEKATFGMKQESVFSIDAA